VFEDGRQVSIGTFKLKGDAVAALAEATTEQRRGTWIEPAAGRVTLVEFAAEWAAELNTLRQSTATRDKGYIDWYILASFGAMRLDQIDYLKVQTWVAEMMTHPLDPATVVKAHQIGAPRPPGGAGDLQPPGRPGGRGRRRSGDASRHGCEAACST
jgi:hypothetical protein